MKQYLKLDYRMIVDKNISSNEFRIMCYLIRYINKDTGESYPSIEKIATDTGISIATVKRSIKNLSKQEYFTINSLKGKAGRRNVYSNFKYDLSKEDLDNQTNVIKFNNHRENNTKKKLKFHDFKSRDYSDEYYNDLERKLLGWD